jgi:hypothetical protein
VIPVGRPFNDVKPVHPEKADPPISVTPSATVNPVILVSPSNDVSPSYTTIFSSITQPSDLRFFDSDSDSDDDDSDAPQSSDSDSDSSDDDINTQLLVENPRKQKSRKDMGWLDIECMKLETQETRGNERINPE